MRTQRERADREQRKRGEIKEEQSGERKNSYERGKNCLFWYMTQILDWYLKYTGLRSSSQKPCGSRGEKAYFYGIKENLLKIQRIDRDKCFTHYLKRFYPLITHKKSFFLSNNCFLATYHLLLAIDIFSIVLFACSQQSFVT